MQYYLSLAMPMKWLIKKRKNLLIFHNNDGIRLFEQTLHTITFISLSPYLPEKDSKYEP